MEWTRRESPGLSCCLPGALELDQAFASLLEDRADRPSRRLALGQGGNQQRSHPDLLRRPSDIRQSIRLDLCARRAAARRGDQTWAVYAQSTFTEQYHPAFASAYRGAHSLDPGSRADETLDVTLYGGVRPWRGAEIGITPEVEQGFGFSNTFGVAGFPSAESYKLGAADPYVRLQRLFLRQTIDLGGATETVKPDLDQLAGHQTADRLVLWVGKFTVTDIFDANKFAHDARHDFLNWSIVDAGSFDYAGDAWGYTYGAAAEWYQSWWAVRGGIVDLPTRPPTNTSTLASARSSSCSSWRSATPSLAGTAR